MDSKDVACFIGTYKALLSLTKALSSDWPRKNSSPFLTVHLKKGLLFGQQHKKQIGSSYFVCCSIKVFTYQLFNDYIRHRQKYFWRLCANWNVLWYVLSQVSVFCHTKGNWVSSAWKLYRQVYQFCSINLSYFYSLKVQGQTILLHKLWGHFSRPNKWCVYAREGIQLSSWNGKLN